MCSHHLLKSFLLELRSDGNPVRRLSAKIKQSEGVFVKQEFIMTNGMASFSKLRTKIGSKIIIFDLRLEHPSIEDYNSWSSLIRKAPIDGVTVMGVYDWEPLISAVSRLRKEIYAIIDMGVPAFRSQVPDRALIELAAAAFEFGCHGVIMTASFPQRIHLVRKELGSGVLIVATNEGKTPLGGSLQAGSNLEVIGSHMWLHNNLSEIKGLH